MTRGTPRTGRWGQSMVSALTLTALAACLAGCAAVGAGVTAPTPSGASSAPPPAPTPAVQVPVSPATPAAPVDAVAPVRVRIDAIGADLPVTGVGVEPSGQMELPVDPAVAGWYRFGPDAASTAGHIMLAAHVDAPGYPIGPLARLRDLPAGAPVTLEAADGTARAYAVESVTFYEKTALPTAELFARDGAPALVIITCGGPFDPTTGHYRDNVVAIARPR